MSMLQQSYQFINDTVSVYTKQFWTGNRRRLLRRLLRRLRFSPPPIEQVKTIRQPRHVIKALEAVNDPLPIVFTFDRSETFGEKQQHSREFANIDERRLWNALADPNRIGDQLPEIMICCDRLKFNGQIEMSPAGLQSLQLENAGGKSELSEALSITYFEQLWKAKDFIFEKQIQYWCDYKMIDFICTIPPYGRLGVSVTRAMSHPSPDRFTYSDAEALLQKKLNGLIMARNAVSEHFTFYHSILHVFCQTEKIAGYIARAYENIDLPEVHGTLVLLITICDDPLIYQNTYTPELSQQLIELAPPQESVVVSSPATLSQENFESLEALSMFNESS